MRDTAARCPLPVPRPRWWRETASKAALGPSGGPPRASACRTEPQRSLSDLCCSPCRSLRRLSVRSELPGAALGRYRATQRLPRDRTWSISQGQQLPASTRAAGRQAARVLSCGPLARERLLSERPPQEGLRRGPRAQQQQQKQQQLTRLIVFSLSDHACY